MRKPGVTVDSGKALPDTDCPLARYDIDVRIDRIEFTGPSGAALPAAISSTLSGVSADPPTGTQKVGVVCTIRDRATEALRMKGYVASVQVPPQRIENGTLRLEVVTAHIVEVRVRGDAGPYRRTLAARIAQLQKLDPLNERDAERILLLADDVPGLDVRLALRPAGTVPGAVIGELTVTVLRARALFNAQNYGSRQLGRETIYGRAEVYGLTGASDMTYIGAQTTADFREQRVLQVGHVTGLGDHGLTFSIAGTYAWSRPDLGPLDLRAQSLIAEGEVAAPIVRTVRDNLTIAAGFDFAEQRTRVYGSGGSSPLNRDRLRTLYLRVGAASRGLLPDGSETYALAGSVQIRKGLGLFDATRPRTFIGGYTPSRFEGDAQAVVIRGEASGHVSLNRIFSIAAEAQGQWADRPLLNFDEYSIGNLTIGRGYDPGANGGDRAIGLRGEGRATVVNRPGVTVNVFGFYDSVWLWNLDTGSLENNRRLGSYGGGFRVLLPRLLAFEATYARPEQPALLLPGARRSPDRLLLSLTVQFAPKSR